MSLTRGGDEDAVAVDLVSLRRRLRASLPLIVAMTVIGGILGGLWAHQAPGTYSADATVALGPSYVAGNEGLTTTNVNTATERQVALSAAVIDQLLPTAGGSGTVAAFRQRASVATPPDSTTLILTVEGTSAQTVASEVQAWSDAYLQYRTEAAAAAVADAVERLDAAIEAANVDLERSTRRQAASPNGTVRERTASAERSLALAEVSSLQAKRTSLATASPPQDRLLGSPQVPNRPDGLGIVSWVFIGVVLGALAGMLLAILRSRESGVVGGEATPIDISAYVAVDLTVDDAVVEEEMGALIARMRALPGVRERGVTIASGTPAGSVFATQLAAAGKEQGVDVVTVLDFRLVEQQKGERTRPLLLVTSAEGRDPWLAALAPAAVACLILAVPGRSTVASVRASLRTVTSAGSLPLVVVVRAEVLTDTESSARAKASARAQVVDE